MMADMVAVSVVGLGAMGGRIARRLIDADHEVCVWNRTASKVGPLVALGAIAASSPAEAAQQADVVITMVSDQAALDAVVQGAAGIAAGVDASTTLIEMSTVGPVAVAELASVLPAGTGVLDAPVLGSISEAEAGTLTIFVGGASVLVERWEPLLSSLGSTMHVGPLGSGASAKLVANLTLFGTLGVLGEAVALGQGLGLPRNRIFDVLSTTPLASQAERRRAGIETGSFPTRFPLSLARKDADLITEAAAAFHVDLRLAQAAAAWLADAEGSGSGDRDYAAVLEAIIDKGSHD
jgi:3-hydroxyisobutyrate dehydrogenase-like beta-hydroxyacid dehydrogenase